MVGKKREAALSSAPAPARAADPRKNALVAVLKAADRLQREFVELLDPHGLTLQQYNVLRILRGALPDALPTMEIAQRMIERTPAITGLLDRLEAKRLVTRARQSDDRRCVRCSITAPGLELLAALDAPIESADSRVLARLSDAEIRQLSKLLAMVAEE